jgi:hypothetical protein
LGILGFSPTRHLLFLGPIILIIIALQISSFFEKAGPKYDYIFLILTLVFVTLGFLGFIHRSNQVFNNAIIPESLLKNVDYILVNDCSYNLIYKNYPENKKILMAVGDEALNPASNELVDIPVGDKILYVSQTIKFDRWKSNLTIRNKSFNCFGGDSISSNIFFTAYNPDATFSDIRFMHNRPNNFYYEVFEIEKLKSQPTKNAK